MAMQVQIDERLYRQLEQLAQQQGTEVDQLVNTMVEEYVERQTETERFRAEVREAMKKHAGLLDKLAKS